MRADAIPSSTGADACPPGASVSAAGVRTVESAGQAATRWWLLVTGGGAFVASVMDAALLERKRGLFSGGFLSVEHLKTSWDVFGFLAGSLLADLAVIGVPAALALWVCGRWGVRRRTAILSAVCACLAPLVVANIASYELAAYLGDAFDLSLMFDLTGRRSSEIFAVSAEHLGLFAALIAAGGLSVAGSIWLLDRVWPDRSGQLSGAPRLWIPCTVLIVGLVGVSALRYSKEELDNGLRRKPSGRVLGMFATALTDFDGDGYGLLRVPLDSDLWNARVFPYAPEIPGNGVDENGVGGDLPSSVAAYTEPVQAAGGWVRKPDVILFVLESFRAETVGATWRGSRVTPTLDTLTARGVGSSRAFSHNGYTTHSRHHLFSGSLAGVRRGTLVDDFKAAGYEVAYFSAQDESFGTAAQDVGFERADVRYDARVQPELRYTTFSTPGSLAIPHQVLTEQVQRFLTTRNRSRPLFLYVNFHDTHFPYHHRQIGALLSRTVVAQRDIGPNRAAALREMYLNTAANVDFAIGDVLGTARTTLEREPGVIVTADHGESLYEEGFLGHGYAINDVQTRIPLIVANLPLTIEEPFAQSDLRDALHAALRTPPEAPSTPIVRTRAGKRVFQYLGLISKPTQIAFTDEHGRIAFDLRTGRSRTAEGTWIRPETLPADASGAVQELVWTWERMMLARTAQGGAAANGGAR